MLSKKVIYRKRKVSVFFGVDGVDQKSLSTYRIGSNFKKIKAKLQDDYHLSEADLIIVEEFARTY